MSEVNNPERIALTVDGKDFQIKSAILQTIPGSLLAEIDTSSPYYNKDNDVYEFDRDPDVFKHVLNTYKYGQLHLSKHMCPVHFKMELEFWRIPISYLSPCCWKAFYAADEEVSIINTLLSRLSKRMPINKVDWHRPQLSGQSTSNDKDGNNPVNNANFIDTHAVKSGSFQGSAVPKVNTLNRLWLFLEMPGSSKAAKMWCFLYLTVVVVSVVMIILWSLPTFRVDAYLNPVFNISYFDLDPDMREAVERDLECSSHELLFILTDSHPAIFAIDLFCLLFFTVETVLHFVSCPHKKSYLRNIDNLNKMVMCITMAIAVAGECNRSLFEDDVKLKLYIVIRSISVMRLILIFRLRKLYRTLDVMLLSLEESLKELRLLIFVFSVCTIIYGTVIFCAEISTNKFPNIWYGMWWALITMTTVGYGDFYPTTALGFVVGSMAAVNGLIILALPVAAIASNFSAYYTTNSDFDKHQTATETLQQKHVEKQEHIPKQNSDMKY